MLLSTTEAFELLEIEQAFLLFGCGLFFVNCRLAARLFEILEENIDDVVFLVVQILVSEELQVRKLSDVSNDIKQLTKLDSELFVKYVLDRLLRLSRIEARITDCASKRDQFVQVKSDIDNHPDRQVHFLFVKHTRADNGLQHG